MKNEHLWETFPQLVEAVKADHIGHGAVDGGHDFYHALVVARYAQIIAPDQETATLGWVAGLLHNTDRIYPKLEVISAVTRYLRLVNTKIPSGNLYILRAVLEHSKRNEPNDPPVTITLKDADRLGNIGSLQFLRSGQFRPNIPAVDPRFITTSDPKATFRNPRSLLQDLKHTLEWEGWLRLTKAQELGKPMFDEIRRFIANIERQFSTLGLLPFPPELAVELSA